MLGKLVFLLSLACLTACQAPQSQVPEDENPVILELNKKPYHYDQYRFFVSHKYPEGAHIDSDDIQSAYLDAFARELYLYEIAVDKGFRATDHQVNTFIRDQLTSMSFHLLPPQEQTIWRDAIERRLAIREMMRNEVLKLNDIPDEQVKAAYEEQSAKYNTDQQYRLRMFRTHEEPIAAAFLEALKASREPFAAVADQQEGHDGSHRLTLELTEEAILPEFHAALRRMNPGQYSNVIPIKQGEAQSFYVLYLEAVLPPRQISYDEAQHEIRTVLQQQTAQSFIEEQLIRYREQLPLQIHFERLPFKYIELKNRSES